MSVHQLRPARADARQRLLAKVAGHLRERGHQASCRAEGGYDRGSMYGDATYLIQLDRSSSDETFGPWLEGRLSDEEFEVAAEKMADGLWRADADPMWTAENIVEAISTQFPDLTAKVHVFPRVDAIDRAETRKAPKRKKSGGSATLVIENLGHVRTQSILVAATSVAGVTVVGPPTRKSGKIEVTISLRPFLALGPTAKKIATAMQQREILDARVSLFDSRGTEHPGDLSPLESLALAIDAAQPKRSA